MSDDKKKHKKKNKSTDKKGQGKKIDAKKAQSPKTPSAKAPSAKAASVKKHVAPPAPAAIDAHILEAVAAGSYYNPHEILGQHLAHQAGVSDPLVIIRALRPLATEVFAILANGSHVELAHLAHGRKSVV